VSTVLLGWELGAGFGHVSGLLTIADALSQRGMQPVLAVSDLHGPWPLLRTSPFPVLAAPRLRPHPDVSFSARGFGDVLAASGFADAPGLAASLRAWDSLLDVVRPAVVVTNHAPALGLAAFGVVPTLVTGTGFTVPPADGATFPKLVVGAPPAIGGSVEDVVRAVLAERGRPAPAQLTELYRTDAYALTLPELDPYQPVRQQPVAGPLRALSEVLASAAERRFFAYLSADTSWAEVALVGMARIASGGVYLRGAGPATLQRLEAAGLRVWAEAPPLAEVLASSTVVVHHGGHATAQTAVAAGRPQLCLPRHLEQSLNGHLLEQLGVARCLRGELPPEAPVDALASLLTDATVEQAHATAVGIAARADVPCLDALADRAVELAGG
jgi:hypothetical protein